MSDPVSAAPQKESCCTRQLRWKTLTRSVIDSSSLTSPSVLFGYRLFVLLFCLASFWTDYAFFGTEDILEAVSYFQFLTHWDSANLLIYFSLSCFFSWRAIKNPSVSLLLLSSTKIGCFVHFMFELTFVTAWFVSLLYWAVLFPLITTRPTKGYAFLNLAMHGLPAFWMIVELLLSNQVLVHFHLLFVYVYMIVYLIVNALVSIFHAPVYGVLTFRSAASAILLAVSVVLILVLWGFAYLWIRIRFRCCSLHRSETMARTKSQPLARPTAEI